jgi:glycosyltransferase involved in cell wall biosynthesis
MMINENSLTEKVHNGPRIPILFAVTSASTWCFFNGIMGMLQDAGFDPVLVSSPGEQLQATAQRARVRHAAVPMSREISLVRDLVSLWRLFRLIRRVRPMITNVGTPKAGLLAGLAAWSLRVPCRIYTLHGLRLETTAGLKRMLLVTMERIACACAHRVICVSPSLRQRAIELKLAPAGKTVVLGSGSCGGIDVRHFSPAVRNSPEKDLLADQLGIPHGVPVIGFVGRFTRDKGIGELIAAFSKLRQSWPSLRVLLVGEFEDGDPVPAEIRSQIEADRNIVRTGYVSDTAPFYGLMDILVLPTHREGMCYAPLEAQACCVPVVTTTATGAIDSIVEGLTGFLVPVGSAHALTARIEELLQNPELRARMGQAGRDRIVREFRQEKVASALIEENRRRIQDRTVTDTLRLKIKSPIAD